MKQLKELTPVALTAAGLLIGCGCKWWCPLVGLLLLGAADAVGRKAGVMC